jgi:hypothetical protein
LWFTQDEDFASRGVTVNGFYRPLAGDFDADDADEIFWYAPGTERDARWDFHGRGYLAALPLNVDGVYWPFTGDFDGNGADDPFWYG